MPIAWFKEVYIKIPRIGVYIYKTVLRSVKEGFVVVTNIYNQNVVMHILYLIHCEFESAYR
jgi:hypothetical protein